MAAQGSLRASLGRLVGRGNLEIAERQRLAQLESRVATLGDQVQELADALERLRTTVVAADPEMMRQIVDSLRADVVELTTEVNTQLSRVAQG